MRSEEGRRKKAGYFIRPTPSLAIWRVVLLVACFAGIWLGRRERLLHLWLLFAGAKVVVVVAFFGYARHGATLIPVWRLSRRWGWPASRGR